MRAIPVAIALSTLLLTLPALARPDARAESGAASPEILLVEVGWVGHTQPDAVSNGWPIIGVGGYSVALGMRHGAWLVTEARADLVADDTARGFGGQLAALWDPGWVLSPILGSYVGYRETEIDWETERPCIGCFIGGDPDHVGTTERRSALAGVESGLRLRAGPVVATASAQWGVSVWSRHRTTVHTEGWHDAPRYVRPSGYGEFNLGLKVGARF